MIKITKTEKDIICKCVPNVKIARTVKGRSNRHKYYCEETPAVIATLKSVRAGIVYV